MSCVILQIEAAERTSIDLSGIFDSSHYENVVQLSSFDGKSVRDSSSRDNEMIVCLGRIDAL